MIEKNRRILIVDDCREDREVYRRYLGEDSTYSYKIFEGEDGENGLELYQQIQPDVILLDYMLPDTDGLEFLSSLKVQTGKKHLPVVMLTGQGNEAIAVAAIKNGAEDYLVKGKTTPESLRMAIHNAIERHNLQRQLEESEERFRTSVENMLDGFGIYKSLRDESGKITDFIVEYVNAAACQNNRMSAEEQIGKKLGELLPAQVKNGLFEDYCQVVETGEPLYKEAVIYSDNYGEENLTRFFDISVAKLGDGFVATGRDITERKRSSERLRLLESVVVNTKDAVIVTEIAPLDAPGPRIIYVNEAFTKMTGYSLKEIVGKSPRFLQGDKTDRATLKQIRAALAAKETIQVDLINYRKDGSEFWVEMTITPVVDRAGEYTHFVAIQREITSRKRTEEILRQNQEFMQKIVDTTPGLLYVYDLIAGQNIYINPQINEVLGYNPAQIQAMGSEMMPLLMHPEDLAGQSAFLAQIQSSAEGEVVGNEYRMRHANGEWRWFYSRDMVFTRMADGLPCQIIGTAQDITERKLVEEELRRANKQFKLAASAGKCLIYDLDMESNRVERNGALNEILGYSIEEAEPTGEWWYNRIHPEDRERLKSDVAALLGTSDRFAIEYRVRHKNNEYVYILDHSLIIRDGEGKPVRVVGTTIDITQRKQAEAEINRLNKELECRVNELQTLLDLLPVGISIAEDPKCSLIRVNPFLQKILNLAPDSNASKTGPDAEKLPYKILINGQEVPGEEMPMQVCAATGVEIPDREMQIVRDDGAIFDLLGHTKPLFDEEGKVRGCVGAYMDISDRKQVETERDQLLILAQKARASAEAANKAKDDFVAMVSHDLRAPLNAILGWAQLLRKKKFDDEAKERALEIIERNAKSQAKLLEDLLDVSRMIQGQLQIHPQQVALAPTIQNAIDTAYISANQKGICLTSALDSSIGTILGDPNRLQQVLANLLANAIKFTPEGGEIDVWLERVDGYAQIGVRDTGQGIDPEFLPKVFDRFRQSSSGSKQGGLGLGLAIARHLIELHQGTIEAYSEGIGQGATFTINLPLLQRLEIKNKTLAPDDENSLLIS